AQARLPARAPGSCSIKQQCRPTRSVLASRPSLKLVRVEHVSVERRERDNISRTRPLRSLICKYCLVDTFWPFWWSSARSFRTPLPRIPESLATVALRHPSLLVVVLPPGNRCLSKNKFPSILTTG